MNVRFFSTSLSIRCILPMLLFVALAGCTSREYTQASGMGWVDFAISTNAGVLESFGDPSYSLTVTSSDGVYSHTWQSFSEYPKYEPYSIGKYSARAISGSEDAEGFNCPCFAGNADFDVIESKHSVFDIECSLIQSIVNISFGEKLKADCPEAKVTVHSSGHGYVEVDKSDAGPAFILPGTTYLYVTVQDAQSRSVTVAPDFRLETEASKSYSISLELTADSQLEVTCGDIISQMPISEELFQSAEPSIESVGFNSGEELAITEGFPANDKIQMIVNAPAGLSSVILTADDGSGFLPSECDLLDSNSTFALHGLSIDRVSDELMIIDFTDMLENLGVNANSEFTFMLQARDRLNRVSDVSLLRVSIKSVELALVSAPLCDVGQETATVDVSLSSPEFSRDDFSVYILGDEHAEWHEAEIIDCAFTSVDGASEAFNRARITFKADNALDDFTARVDFMGNPKLYVKVERQIPEYEIFVDAFALSANIYVTSANTSLREIIVKNATVKANGADAAILERNEENGMISIAQLSPSTAYDISTILIPGRYAPTVKATTEKAEQVPSGDFEEFEDLLEYKKLPCGGIYSNTVFPIYNMQNFIDIDVKWPKKHWASTNAKTFCKSAANANSWYMHPSAELCFDMSASGTKSMQMQTVGWSLEGEEIPPYKQADGDSFLPYNDNVPPVAHRSAGKVFLGTYKFDPANLTEAYEEGVNFQSRPRSLNGFFQYVSDPSYTDNGLVIVELINDAGSEPISVASASLRFDNSPGFTSFNLPLTYHTVGVKATKLRIMFSSSYHYGNIHEEDEETPATPYPSKGMYLGSTLRVDNLSFSY